MKLVHLALAGIAAAATLAPALDAFAAGPRRDYKPASCSRHYGKGWAPTEEMAKFQAWEIIAQTTGNWPIATDKLTNERYSCKSEGGQWFCRSQVDVCKS